MTVLHVARQIFRCSSQFAHQHHQVLLDGRQALLQAIVFRRSAGQPDGGIEFVHRAVGLDAGMTLGHLAVVHQRRRAPVSALGDDAHSAPESSKPRSVTRESLKAHAKCRPSWLAGRRSRIRFFTLGCPSRKASPIWEKACLELPPRVLLACYPGTATVLPTALW